MLRICLGILAGGAAMSLLPRLPSANLILPAAALCVLLAIPVSTRLLAAALVGAVALWLAATFALDQRLLQSDSGNEFKFTAEVIDFTVINGQLARMLVAPEPDSGLPPRIRLSGYDLTRVPQLGEHWQFLASLRRPRGSRNPGGFDYAGWLHRNSIGATGYVRTATPLDSVALSRSAQLRRAAAARISAVLPADDASAALLAISIGARQQISRAAWQRYAETGTSHLMAISGLHVGLAASFAGLVAWLLLALCRPRGNSRDTAAVLAAIAALGYATLSGFAVPAQRASLMVVVAALALCWRWKLAGAQVVAAIAVAVYVSAPLTLLSPGFLLSFSAVAVLLSLTSRSSAQQTPLVAWCRELSILQAALLLGLFPLTAVFFARVAWLAPLANLLVLPLFSFLTVPAALLGLVFCGPAAALGDVFLWCAYYSLRLILDVLAFLQNLPAAQLGLAEPQGMAALLWLLPAVWVLLPPGLPGRYLGWLAVAAATLYRPAGPPESCIDVVNLDVGQGLATVLRTAQHTLLFDTGPAFRAGSNSATLMVLPYLQSIGVQKLDLLVISHADQDHAGGVASILDGLPVARLLAGEPLPGQDTTACAAGQAWRWDGIDFAILHPDPDPDSRFSGNNASCVLMVTTGSHRLLLTGDIEAPVERRLLRAASVPRSDLVVVPHHGSRTSSSAAFAEALGAQSAVVSAGHDNRWGFPKEDVVMRWERAGTGVLTTARSGAIAHRLCRDGGLSLQSEYRLDNARYWHDLDD